MLATYCQGFGEVAQALVLETRVYAVAGHSMKLSYTSNHTVSCIKYYSLEALAEHAWALRYQHRGISSFAAFISYSNSICNSMVVCVSSILQSCASGQELFVGDGRPLCLHSVKSAQDFT